MYKARLIVSLAHPHSVIFINSAWWKLVGYLEALCPSETEDKTLPLQEIFQMHNLPHRENQTILFDRLISLLPRVSKGIPIRLSQITQSKDNKKVFLYIKVVPLVNESMEISHAQVSMYETFPSSSLEESLKDDSVFLSTPAINQSTPGISISQSDSEWTTVFKQQQQLQQNHSQGNLVVSGISNNNNSNSNNRNSTTTINTQNSIPFDQSPFYLYSCQHSPPPLIDPVWGTDLSRTYEIPSTESFSQSRSTLLFNSSGIVGDHKLTNSSGHKHPHTMSQIIQQETSSAPLT